VPVKLDVSSGVACEAALIFGVASAISKIVDCLGMPGNVSRLAGFTAMIRPTDRTHTRNSLQASRCDRTWSITPPQNTYTTYSMPPVGMKLPNR